MEAEKANANRKHNLFADISKTLRIFELCIFLLFLSWTLTRLPFVLTVSAEYLRSLASSPLFIFAISNVIIAALFAQSGRFSGQHSTDQTSAGDFYREIMNNRVTERREPPSTAADPPSDAVIPPPRAAAEVVECHDKKVVSETVRDRKNRASSDLADFRRSQSEKWKGEAGKMLQRKQLRRSETEKLLEKERENLYPQDKLSNEEFQRTIEAFIAKQMRSLREESSAIVVHKTA